MSGFVFEKHLQYCMLCFTAQLEAMTRDEVENATAVIPELVRGATTHAVLADLSRLKKIPAGLLPTLMLAWKAMDAADRRFVVFATQSSIREELKETGLDELWTVVDSADASIKALKASDDAGDVIDAATQLDNGNNALSNSPDSPIRMQRQKRFDTVQFLPNGATMNWHEVEAATTDVVRQLRESEHLNVMVDLSQMRMINSGLIASLVRIWKVTKERRGQFSLVSPNENVTEVLKTAGLWKLWSVVENREEAVYHLGVSKAAIVERRERRFLILVAVPCAVIAALALIPMFLKHSEVMGVNAQLTALLFASAAVATGLIAVVKESGIYRVVACISVVFGLLVLSSLAFEGSPVSFSRGALKTDSTGKSK
jgi:anti-anti-sigma factor